MGQIIWSNTALKQLESIHFYVLFESKSITIADKLVETIFESTDILKTHPLIYSIDKLKKDNDGSFRSYFILSYKIAYRVTESEIQILRVRHTSRKQKKI